MRHETANPYGKSGIYYRFGSSTVRAPTARIKSGLWDTIAKTIEKFSPTESANLSILRYLMATTNVSFIEFSYW